MFFEVLGGSFEFGQISLTLTYERPVGVPRNMGSCTVPAKHTMLELLYRSSDNFSCIYK